ncbi:MAG: 16S rRNA pseudouridine(516) synthase [Rubrivivax sp.]
MPRRDPNPTASLAQILFEQGFGTRREVAGLLERGAVCVAGRVVSDGLERFATGGLSVVVDGTPWPVHERAVVMLHKPAGYECSAKPGAWPSVLSLLPAPLLRRGVQPVGRLDQDTTGLLLLTDDGTLLHRLTSPRWHVPKIYRVQTARPVDEAQVQALRAGVVLRDDPKPAVATRAEVTGPMALELVLTEGRYHQVKRMLAAVGNHVESLHRHAIGALELPTDLAPGQWRWVPAEAVDTFVARMGPARPDA